MGAVFRGLDPRLRRPVALKTLRLGGGDLLPDKRRQRIEQLVQEAVTGARFSHPNVVAVYDVEESPEGAFIAMELVDGASLERVLLRRGRLSPREVIPLGAGIARGLAAAHQRDIVHRDIKPANVMLGHDGSIKVTDFGIADLVAAATRAEGLVFGTPGYLPPGGAARRRARPVRRPLRPRGAALRVPGGGAAVRRHRRAGPGADDAVRRRSQPLGGGWRGRCRRSSNRSSCSSSSATPRAAPPTPPPSPTSSTAWPRRAACAGSSTRRRGARGPRGSPARRPWRRSGCPRLAGDQGVGR